MKIAVLIKQVPVSNDVSVDPVTHALIRASSEGMINPADTNALEAALVLKENCDAQVVAFTMGPPQAEQSLRDALAMGCDEACLISDRCFAGADTLATAQVLAKSILEFAEFDLVLCGAQSVDGATGQVGAMVAEILGIPHVTEIQGVQYGAQKEALVQKKYGEKQFMLSVQLPALLSLSFGCNEPRLPTLRSKRAAKSKEIVNYSNRELKMSEESVGLLGSPTIVVDSFAPKQAKTACILQGSEKELADKVMELIEAEKGKK